MNLTDNLNGSYALTKVQRGGTAASGGTDITPAAAVQGAVGTTTGWTFTAFVGDCVQKGLATIVADKSLNG